ncbi:MAG: hypothetical protein AAFR81_13345 [Chloroflexota bacterium]
MAEIFDALRRDGDSSNTIIGIVILVLMSVFVAPDVLPQLVADSVPFIEEGLPCDQLTDTLDRANHQSLISRAANDALTLRTEVGRFPDPASTNPFIVRIIVINNTIGSVPFIYNRNQVIVGNDPNTSGLGLQFNPPVAISLDTNGDGIQNNATRPQAASVIPQTDVRILGPGQRCVVRVEIPNLQSQLIQPGISEVRSYYRILSAGTVQQSNPLATPIFGDMGLNVVAGNFVESEPVVIPVTAFANTGS